MSDLLPEGEDLRRALQWIGDRRKEDPSANLAKILDEASLRFDLSPRDQEFLLSALGKKREES